MFFQSIGASSDVQCCEENGANDPTLPIDKSNSSEIVENAREVAVRQPKQYYDYKQFNQSDVLDDIHEDRCEGLLIPEISLEAPTPLKNSPCVSPKQEFSHPKRDLVLKYCEEDPMNGEPLSMEADYKISDEDWDRMEAIAEEERLQEEKENGPCQEEINENRRKLQEFRDNPNIDISKSRLAEELKLILEEAKRRVEHEGSSIVKRKKKKGHSKEVTFDTSSNTSYDPVSVKEVLRKVESEIQDDIHPEDDVEYDDSCLLNGFMDGFEEEQECDQPERVMTQLGANQSILMKAGVACLVALGAAMFIKKIQN